MGGGSGGSARLRFREECAGTPWLHAHLGTETGARGHATGACVSCVQCGCASDLPAVPGTSGSHSRVHGPCRAGFRVRRLCVIDHGLGPVPSSEQALSGVLLANLIFKRHVCYILKKSMFLAENLENTEKYKD